MLRDNKEAFWYPKGFFDFYKKICYNIYRKLRKEDKTNMSVDYRAALIYGYDLSDQIRTLPEDFKEQAENAGFNVVFDFYDEDFLYVGISISDISAWDEVCICIETAKVKAEDKLAEVLAAAPKDIVKYIPTDWFPSTYHICYAL